MLDIKGKAIGLRLKELRTEKKMTIEKNGNKKWCESETFKENSRW